MTPYNYLLFFSVFGRNVCECLQNVLVTLPKLHIENRIHLETGRKIQGRIPEFPEKQGSRLKTKLSKDVPFFVSWKPMSYIQVEKNQQLKCAVEEMFHYFKVFWTGKQDFILSFLFSFSFGYLSNRPHFLWFTSVNPQKMRSIAVTKQA